MNSYFTKQLAQPWILNCGPGSLCSVARRGLPSGHSRGACLSGLPTGWAPHSFTAGTAGFQRFLGPCTRPASSRCEHIRGLRGWNLEGRPGLCSSLKFQRQSGWHGRGPSQEAPTCHSATKEAHPFPLGRNGSWSSRRPNSRNDGLTSNMSLCTSSQALARLTGPHDSLRGGHPYLSISQRGMPRPGRLMQQQAAAGTLTPHLGTWNASSRK